MRNNAVILLGKSLSKVSSTLNLGNGSTWPGHIALKLNSRFIQETLKGSQTKIIMVAGTNGKTTSTRVIRTILEENNHTIIHNESGANLLNGIASTILLKTTSTGKLIADYAIFEVDENALPHALARIKPDYLVILNLFRDQLDRYGEVAMIAMKWRTAIEKLPEQTTLILNADDPQVAYLGQQTKAQVHYFGLPKTKEGETSEYAADSLFCPHCGTKLTYHSKTYSHLGDWVCPSCHLKRPITDTVTVPYFPLSGMYNEYNTTAVVLLATLLQLPDDIIDRALHQVKAAFGRQEIVDVDGKKTMLFLSKNPTGYNESLRTITQLGAKHVLLVLNDRVADGHDVSWIWDIDFEAFVKQFQSITLSGDRCYDLALRLKYTSDETTFQIEERLEDAIKKSLEKVPKAETLYILPTYTAMLEARKILKGRSIL